MRLTSLVPTITLAAAAVLPASGQRIAPAAVPAAVRQALDARFGGAAPTWMLRADKSYVADFQQKSANVRATFTATGEWRETSTEIGAITLPAAVRTAVLQAYRGYRFADTRRVDRPAPGPTLFEVRLEKPDESVTVRYHPDGSVMSAGTKAAPAIALAGAWRGESICLPGHPACHDEVVIYHITAVATDSTGYDIQADRIVDGRNEDMGTLACSFDRHTPALICAMPQGVWKFVYRNDSLVGGLIGTDGSSVRRVAVRRQK